MTNATNSQMADYLSKHPRMMGVLFTLGLLMLDAIGRAEAGGAATAGP